MADNHICDNQGREESKEESNKSGYQMCMDLKCGDLNYRDLRHREGQVWGSLFCCP